MDLRLAVEDWLNGLVGWILVGGKRVGWLADGGDGLKEKERKEEEEKRKAVDEESGLLYRFFFLLLIVFFC